MDHTLHGCKRSQQRGIPPLVVDLLLQFGAREHAAEGLEILFFDNRSRKRLQAYAGGLIGKLNEQLDTYAVVAGGKVVTVGTRYKRIKHAQ